MKKKGRQGGNFFMEGREIAPGKCAGMIVEEIKGSDFFISRGRNIKIRLTHWLDALCRPQFNSTWRANKLNYLKLLNLMCQCEVITSPFTTFPQPNHIPLLKNHQINQIIDEVERQVRAMLISQQEGERGMYLKSRKPSIERTKPTPTSLSSKNISRARTKMEIDENYLEKAFKMHQMKIQKQNKRVIVYKKEHILAHAQEQHPIRRRNNLSALKLDYNHSQKGRFSFSSNKISYQRDNNKYMANLFISPLTVSSILWQHSHNDQAPHSKTTNLTKSVRLEPSRRSFHSNHHLAIDTTTGKRQYWQSSSNTGNATPKYFNNYLQQPHVVQCEEYSYSQRPTDRSAQPCDCLGVFSSIVS